MPKSIQEAMNRGNNLLMVTFVAVIAAGVFSLIFVERELLDKADDIFFAILGIVAVAWYLSGRNRYRYSWVPFGLVATGFLVKVLAFINEFDDPVSAGDEYGVVPAMAIVTVLSAVLMIRARRMNQEEKDRVPGAASSRVGDPHDDQPQV